MFPFIMSSRKVGIGDVALSFTDPFDPKNIKQASLGMEGAPPDIVGARTVSSLLPGDLKDKYNTFDCHKRALRCTVGDDFTCMACRTLGGGSCVKASKELKGMKGWDETDSTVGVCLSFDYGLGSFIEAETVNPFTTTEEAFVGVFKDGSDFIAMRRGCIDDTLVRKDPSIDPRFGDVVGCTDVVMCGEKGIPVHPMSGREIVDVDDIDFDIAQMASTMQCLCDAGYKSVKNDLTGVPTCERSAPATLWQEDSKASYGCPVRFSIRGVEEGCLSDPALHVRATSLDASLDPLTLQKGGVDYGFDYMVSLKRLKQALDVSGVSDACLPRPGVDPRVSAIGYTYAVHLFSAVPELTAFKGGHLVTGGLLRRSAMTENGTWHSWIENAEEGKHVTSESLGGVVPYVGTGSIAAHVTNGDDLSTNGLTGPGGHASLSVHPNASMRVVPVPWSTIPGVGGDSMDHAVGMVASQGRVYPSGVHERMQYGSSVVQPNQRGATEEKESSYLTEDDSPLKLDRICHDSGICSVAFVVPRKEGRPPSFYNPFVEDPALKNAVKLPLKTTGGNLIMRKKVCHTPLERIFDVSLDTITDLSGETLMVMPGSAELMTKRNDLPRLWDARVLARSAFGKRMYNSSGSDADTLALRLMLYGYKGYGGLMIQPVATKLAKNGGKSSMFARFAEEMLSENSPKIIDHYKTHVKNGVKIEERDLELFPKLPVASRIASNESSFFSGRGLGNGLNNTGMTAAESNTTPDAKPDVLLGAVLSGDSVLMNGDSAKITRPLNVPCSVFPETLWHERRSPSRPAGDAGSATVLERMRNAFWRITGKKFAAHLNAEVGIEAFKGNENTYCPSKPFFAKVARFPTWFQAAHIFLAAFSPFSLDPVEIVESLSSEEDFEKYVGSLLLISPAKFSGTDKYWQQGAVGGSNKGLDIIPTPMPLLESLMRVRTLASENFIRTEIVASSLRADWAESTHSAGHYMMGHHSPPTLKEETGKTYGYPCTGALAQFMTLLVPRVLSEENRPNIGAHSRYTRTDMEALVRLNAETAQNLLDVSPLDLMAPYAKGETCNCTCDVFCPRLNAEGRDGSVAGVPSRCNRNAQFLLSSTLPKNDISLSYALLMAQAGDKSVSEALERGADDRNGHQPNLDHITGQLGWHSATTVPYAPNRWRAARSNRGFTPYSSRLEDTPATFLNRTNLWEPSFDRRAKTMGPGDHDADMPAPLVYTKDDVDGLTQESIGDKILNRTYADASMTGERGSKARRRLDFFENATGTAPSTFNVGMFNPYNEGARDVVVLYGTPIMTDPAIWWAVRNREGRSSPTTTPDGSNLALQSIAALIYDKIQRDHDKILMRRIFTMPVNVSSFEGFACGLTAAEATCTRGTEIWYKNKTKPPLNRGIGTTREGISSKAPDPFDALSVQLYASLDLEELQKYANHHHFGYDGLFSIQYADKQRQRQLHYGSEDFYDDLYAFPFACQSDRRPWPLTKEGYTSRAALVDMGVL